MKAKQKATKLSQGHLTDLFGEISVRMEFLAGWQTEQIIHRTDRFAGKFLRTDKILNSHFCQKKNKFDHNRV